MIRPAEAAAETPKEKHERLVKRYLDPTMVARSRRRPDASLTMEDVMARARRKNVMREGLIPHRGVRPADLSDEQWRKIVHKTHATVNEDVLREMYRQKQMAEKDKERRDMPAPAARPRQEADDRHSRRKAEERRSGALAGSRHRDKPPDETHDNREVVDLLSAAEAEAEQPAAGVRGRDPHARSEALVDLTLSSADEAAPSPHYRQDADDFPPSNAKNDKIAQSLGFKNTQDWSQAWADVHGEQRTEEMHEMLKRGADKRVDKSKPYDDEMARVYGYRNFSKMRQKIPYMHPHMTHVQWNTRVGAMRKSYKRERDAKHPQPFLGGWTLDDVAKSLGGTSYRNLYTFPNLRRGTDDDPDVWLRDWGKKHIALRKHMKQRKGDLHMDFFAQTVSRGKYKNYNDLQSKWMDDKKDPSKLFKKYARMFKYDTDAPKQKRPLLPDKSQWTIMADPEYRHKFKPGPATLDPDLGAAAFGGYSFDSVTAVVQSQAAARGRRPASSRAATDLSSTLNGNGQPVNQAQASAAQPLRQSGSSGRPKRAAARAVLTYTEPPDSPSREPNWKRVAQEKIREVSVDVKNMPEDVVLKQLKEHKIKHDPRKSVDDLRILLQNWFITEITKRAKREAAASRDLSPGRARPKKKRDRSPRPSRPSRRERSGDRRRATSAGPPRRRFPTPSAAVGPYHPRARPTGLRGDPLLGISSLLGTSVRPQEVPPDGDPDEKESEAPVTPTPPRRGWSGTPIEQQRALGRSLRRMAVQPRLPPALIRHVRKRYTKTVGAAPVRQVRNVTSPYVATYTPKGGHGWTPTPRLSVNQIDSGRYLLRARRGITKGVRHQVVHLLNRVRGKVKVNGRVLRKKQAREVIIDLLAQNITVDVSIHA